MKTVSAYRSYQQTSIETASPEKLLLMLYSGAIARLERARSELDQRDHAGVHTSLVKVQNIVLELMVSLDWETSPELCGKLHGLYDYVYRRLVEANIHKDPARVDEAIEILSELHSGWEQAILQTDRIPAGEVCKGRLNIRG